MSNYCFHSRGNFSEKSWLAFVSVAGFSFLVFRGCSFSLYGFVFLFLQCFIFDSTVVSENVLEYLIICRTPSLKCSYFFFHFACWEY